MRNRRRNQRSAFTLMEILLVAAILIILASMAVIAYQGIGEDTTKTLARTEIETFETASKMFSMRHMRKPTNIQELITPVNGVKPFIEDADITDPWGHEYVMSFREGMDKPIFTSPGPDGSINTAEDNITNDPNANQR